MQGMGRNDSNPNDDADRPMNTTMPVNNTPTTYYDFSGTGGLLMDLRQGTIDSRWYSSPHNRFTGNPNAERSDSG